MVAPQPREMKVAPLTGELGPLERSVMDLVWDRDEDVSVRDVLGSTVGKGLAYTTVMTILDRLWKKGFLTRRKTGRAYVYRAAVSHADYVAGLIGGVLDGSNDRRGVLLGFVRSVDAGDLAELRRLIRTVERERKRPT